MIDVYSQNFGMEMCRILGLPKNTIWFELRCAVGEIVKVKGQFYPDCGAGDLLNFMNEYEIKKKEPI